jgi:HSP20 family protein
MSMMRTTNSPLRGAFDRFFDDWFGRTAIKPETNGSSVWSPAVNVREDAANLYVEAELPGMQRKDIQIEVADNVLSIKGERRFEKKESKENYHFCESSYGSFYRSFTLPASVDADEIKAEYKDGMLSITLPKREEVKPKKVAIG